MGLRKTGSRRGRTVSATRRAALIGRTERKGATAVKNRIRDEITPVLAALYEAWLRCPELRLGQLLVNVVNPTQPCPEVFYVEDATLAKKLKEWKNAGN